MESEGRRDQPDVARHDEPDTGEDRRDAAATASPEEAAASPPEVAPTPPEVAASPSPDADGARPRGGLRLLAAVVAAPWLVVYGVTGAWAVTRGGRAAADGLSSIDLGYSRSVTPPSVIVVGALLLAAFAVLLAAAMLLLYDVRSRGRWAVVCVVAAVLAAGSIWAAVSGGLNPGLWLLYFGGLLYSTALSLARLLRAPRAAAGFPDQARSD